MKRRLTKRPRFLGLVAVVGILALTLVATAISSTQSKKQAGPLVALLLPENVTVRWEANDKPLFVKNLKKLVPGVRIDVLNALNDPAKQQSQAEAELTKGAKVLVVAPIDQKAFAVVARKAAQQGVKVVAYDRLIRGAPIAAYDSFDGVAVGTAQGKWLAAHTKKGDQIAVINGSFTDDNAHLFQTGYMSILKPLFAKGQRIQLGPKAGQWTDRWDPPTAQRQMEQLLTKYNNNVQGVLSANDGMAGGIIAALKAVGLSGKVPVTGQDATVEGVQRIILGTQGQSVLKDFRLQAAAAARITAALLSGKTPAGLFNKKVNNGAGNVPSVILPVRSIDKSNVGALVNSNWFPTVFGVSKAQLCKPVGKIGACK